MKTFLSTSIAVALVLGCGDALAEDPDPDRFTFQAHGGFQLGWTPGIAVMPGIFAGFGPRIGSFECSADVTLAAGPADGPGFAVLPLAMLSIGWRSPNESGTFVPFLTGHAAGGFFFSQGNGQTDVGGLWTGASAGFRTYGEDQGLGGIVGLTGFVPLERPSLQTNSSGPIVPLFLRGGVSVPR